MVAAWAYQPVGLQQICISYSYHPLSDAVFALLVFMFALTIIQSYWKPDIEKLINETIT